MPQHVLEYKLCLCLNVNPYHDKFTNFETVAAGELNYGSFRAFLGNTLFQDPVC